MRQELVERISAYVIHFKGKGHIAAYFERLLNWLVYELFFEKELHAAKLTVFDHLRSAELLNSPTCSRAPAISRRRSRGADTAPAEQAIAAAKHE